MNNKQDDWPWPNYTATPIDKRLTKEECLRIYGCHIDDGGFMIGFCKRCGHTDDTGGVGCI